MHNQGIGTWITRRSMRSMDDVAISFRDESLGYRSLAQRIRRLAVALADRGVSAGDRVAYLGNNHPSFLESLFATATLGAIFVPLNSRLAAPEIEFALEDSGATTLILHADLRDLARAGAWSTGVTRRIIVAGDSYPAVESYDEVLTSGADVELDVPVTLDDPALILYTSGTTGHPKGAVLTHGNLTWNCFNAIVDYGVHAAERVLLISPLFHVASLSMGALPVLLQGGRVILHEKFDPAHVLKTVAAERVTMLAGVPTTFQMLQEHPDWDTTDISSLQHLTCGGSTMPERMLEAYEQRGLSFSCGYGMTETSPGATAMPPRMSKAKMGSAGIRHFFTDVKIVDEHGADAPVGAVGEIWVSGPNVITEYWRRPEATAAAFVGGWFRSGDLGTMDDEGYLRISDRLKDMIISGGENIYSAEVESIIMEIPEISSVALIGVADERWGEVPLAVVSLKGGAHLPADAIAQHLNGRLAKYKIPQHVVFTDELPRTASGKVRKADLRARYGSGTPLN
ncbi:long-chain fatty acid--CoA ligase [Microbacterium sp. zg-Y818]|uniref:acyl-CoA synthetase n=1 Tax=unclassified Microbacterium TaxID=2609290 RepID=UPI00214C920B|nr:MULTISPECIES: long-chain fatty acid--CoA ligase [unclassified Microbacterium]MCR2800265.1 long-chain fatty acid--CoA ligase [Microbacterium sp. zg.Y818]WIM22228.1 long-chain fatty acid--CoA ligase [Microbacterium sp. zg-Y818]